MLVRVLLPDSRRSHLLSLCFARFSSPFFNTQLPFQSARFCPVGTRGEPAVLVGVEFVKLPLEMAARVARVLARHHAWPLPGSKKPLMQLRLHVAMGVKNLVQVASRFFLVKSLV